MFLKTALADGNCMDSKKGNDRRLTVQKIGRRHGSDTVNGAACYKRVCHVGDKDDHIERKVTVQTYKNHWLKAVYNTTCKSTSMYKIV